MVISRKNIILPKNGKNQVDLKSFGFDLLPKRDSFFTIFLPCARAKPYHKSTTHSYVNLKLKEYIPPLWRKLIRICTISEVIGIVPERLENQIFGLYSDQYYYEHYPSYNEGDVERTIEWLKQYIKDYGTTYNFGYCTSKIFREICEKALVKSFPTRFNPSSALFEFRKTENIKEIFEKIVNIYRKKLANRYEKWKFEESHPYQVLKFALENAPFKFELFKKRFKYLKKPRANIDTFCHESLGDKGIFLYFNHTDKRFHFPSWIINLLNL